MKSIMQDDPNRCYLCGQEAGGDPLDWHHIYGGALRKKSERYGLKVRLHHSRCHTEGKGSVHRCRELSDALKADGQRAAMERYGWTAEDFRREFYKSYV